MRTAEEIYRGVHGKYSSLKPLTEIITEAINEGRKEAIEECAAKAYTRRVMLPQQNAVCASGKCRPRPLSFRPPTTIVDKHSILRLIDDIK